MVAAHHPQGTAKTSVLKPWSSKLDCWISSSACSVGGQTRAGAKDQHGWVILQAADETSDKYYKELGEASLGKSGQVGGDGKSCNTGYGELGYSR